LRDSECFGDTGSVRQLILVDFECWYEFFEKQIAIKNDMNDKGVINEP